MSSQAELKAARRAATKADLARRKKEAEKAIRGTTGLVSKTLGTIREAQRKRQEFLKNL